MDATTHVYRVKLSQRLIGIALLGFGTCCAVALWSGVITGTGDATFLKVIFPALFLLIAGVVAAQAFGTTVRISDQAVEARGLRSTQILPLDKVRGRRRRLDNGAGRAPRTWHILLVSDDDRYQTIDIEEIYAFDEYFYTWFKALPDLDALDKTRPKSSNLGLI